MYEKRFRVLRQLLAFPAEQQNQIDLLRELPKLVSDHVLRYAHIVVDLAVVDLEDEADEVRENRCASSLGFNRRNPIAWLRSYDG